MAGGILSDGLREYFVIMPLGFRGFTARDKMTYLVP
jgi:hypothetical protein